MQQEIRKKENPKSLCSEVVQFKLTEEELKLYLEGGTLGNQEPEERKCIGLYKYNRSD